VNRVSDVTDRPFDPEHDDASPELVGGRDATGRTHVERAETVPTPDAHPDDTGGVDRGALILEGLKGAAAWAWRFLLVAAALAVLFYVLGKLWVGVLPLLLALIVSTVLWGPVRFLTRRGWPSGLAAGLVLLVGLGAFFGSLAAIAPGIVAQGQDIVKQASQGLQQILDWVEGPPLNLQNEQVSEYVDQVSEWLQQQSANIASGVLTGVTTAGSLLVTLAMVLVLTFFFLKDGERFAPWVRRFTGPTAGMHLTEALARMWVTLGGFIRAQALVSLVDAVFIGIGLLVLGVPLAFGLALITFFAGFIPIVGAVTAGALAVLVALVSEGFVTALWVLAIVLAVQQIEGNVLSPILQSKAMDLHPVIILLAVAAGGTRWLRQRAARPAHRHRPGRRAAAAHPRGAACRRPRGGGRPRLPAPGPPGPREGGAGAHRRQAGPGPAGRLAGHRLPRAGAAQPGAAGAHRRRPGHAGHGARGDPSAGGRPVLSTREAGQGCLPRPASLHLPSPRSTSVADPGGTGSRQLPVASFQASLTFSPVCLTSA
jgi:putative heme transporter